jgi:hypothetical protein
MNMTNYVLDPIATICKIALLYYMPEKTKLSINYNSISLQTPTYTQPIERKYNGDSRNDIPNLNTTLIRACEWYIAASDIDENILNKIKNIAVFCIKGLTKLQTGTYSNDIGTKIILQHFINMIQSALDGVWDETTCVHENRYDNEFLIKKIKMIDIDYVVLISNMLDEGTVAESNSDAKKIFGICKFCLEILSSNDTAFEKIMADSSVII